MSSTIEAHPRRTRLFLGSSEQAGPQSLPAVRLGDPQVLNPRVTAPRESVNASDEPVFLVEKTRKSSAVAVAGDSLIELVDRLAQRGLLWLRGRIGDHNRPIGHRERRYLAP